MPYILGRGGWRKKFIRTILKKINFLNKNVNSVNTESQVLAGELLKKLTKRRGPGALGLKPVAS